MTGYLEIFSAFLEDPPCAAESARERRPWGLGFLCFAATGLSLFLAQSLSGSVTIQGPIGLLSACLWQMLCGVVSAGILHLIADAGGGRGSACGLFVLLGLSSLVWTVSLPATLVLRVFYLDGGVARFTVFAVLGCASMALQARSLKDNYGVGSGRAWAILAVPYAAAALLAAVLVILVVTGVALSLARFFS